MLEISMLIPAIIGGFDFELDGRLSEPEAQWAVSDYWFVKPKDFMVRAKIRERECVSRGL